MKHLKIGDSAPAFKVKNQSDRMVELNQFKESMSLPPENESSNEEREKIYSSRVEELEEELRLEKLKREAYQQMIKIADERFKISIKKKFCTKQSNK